MINESSKYADQELFYDAAGRIRRFEVNGRVIFDIPPFKIGGQTSFVCNPPQFSMPEVPLKHDRTKRHASRAELVAWLKEWMKEHDGKPIPARAKTVVAAREKFQDRVTRDAIWKLLDQEAINWKRAPGRPKK